MLRVGGRLLVSEPPDARAGRWPPGELAMLGLVPEGGAESPRIVRFRQGELCPARFPRRAPHPQAAASTHQLQGTVASARDLIAPALEAEDRQAAPAVAAQAEVRASQQSLGAA